ncbi:MAG: 50S ribosomal protein L15 [Candidatus Falkowbacteria bacterium]
MLSLNSLRPAKGSIKNRKRVGRGNASGHGTYATRGLKGQKSRSGVSGLKRLGMRPMLLSLPKKRGFTSLQAKAQVVNLRQLNGKFKDGATISPKSLAHKGLVEDASKTIKLLGQGELKLNNLSIVKIDVSESAKAQIEKLGGKISA